MEYRREIDGLRALAVLLVLLFHAGVPGFSGGFIGVDVFFVISGYLISAIILNELNQGRFSLAHFYERRARRILPALFIVMAASLPLAWLWLAPTDLQDFGKSLISVALYFSNIFFWKQSGYFDTAAELKPMLHTWSLAVEEQYYLVFPPLLLFIWRNCRRYLGLILIFLTLASLSLAEYENLRAPEAAFFLLPTRGWELLAGVLATLYGTSLKKKLLAMKWVSGGADFFGLMLILSAAVVLDDKTPFPGVYGLLPVCGAVAILVYSSPKTFTGRLLGSQAVVGVGLLSYSVYLWHQPVFAFARHASSSPLHWINFVGLGFLSFFLAFLSWRYVERPFRRKDFLTRRRIFMLATTGSVFLFLIGVGAQAANALSKYRLNARQMAWYETAQHSPMRERCHVMGKNQLAPRDSCEYFESNIQWAVLGDSHAVELAYALALELKDTGVGVKHLSSSTCAPSLQAFGSDTECAAWTQAAVEAIEQRSEIKTVVLSYRINKYLWGEHEKTYPALPNMRTDEQRAEIWRNYLDLINRLKASGRRVIVIFQAPELSKRIDDLIFISDDQSRDLSGVPKKWWKLRNKYIYENYLSIPPDVLVFDPAEIFCDQITCHATKDAAALYFDDDHISVEGARVLVRNILKKISRPCQTPATRMNAGDLG